MRDNNHGKSTDRMTEKHIMNGSVNAVKNYGWLSLAFSAALLLLACDATNIDNLTGGTEQAQVMQIRAPLSLLPKDFDPASLQPSATINGEPLGFRPLANGNIWQAETTAPEGSTVSIAIDWIESFNNVNLTLAVYRKTFTNISERVAVNLVDKDYIIDDIENFPSLDEDNDRVANLIERREGSNPTDSLDPGEFRAHTFLPAIDPSSAPRIDGSYDLIWGEAQFQDRDGENLRIDNRMVGNDPLRENSSDVEYRWAGMHDGRFLYLYIFGALADRRTPWGDSVDEWRDDAIDIFWDGDGSFSQTYDQVDDYHLLIPMYKLNQGTPNRSVRPNGTVDFSGRFGVGSNSVAIPAEAIEYAMCECPALNTYELRLDMQALQIPVDRSFGFDVQMNDDADGGDRDHKFGWFHPQAPINVLSFDETWRNPSFMGLAQLQPFATN